MTNSSNRGEFPNVTLASITNRKTVAKRSGKRAGGRPTNYNREYADQARKMCLLMGATDRNLADFFEVNETTINRWKKAHPEFCQSISEGKLIADANVVHSLYSRAVGMSVIKTHLATHQGEVTAIEYLEHIPPDVKACIFWLKNRQKGHWRDVFSHKTDKGGAFSINIHTELHPDDQNAS